MLKQRVITAVVLALALIGALVYLPPLWLMALFAVLVCLAGWEWADLAGFRRPAARLGFCLLCLLAMLGLVYWGQLASATPAVGVVRDVLGVACAWWALALLWVKYYPASASLWGSTFMRGLMGLLVLVPTWLAFAYLRLQEQGILLILLVIILVAGADIGAYFAGRAFGRAKLAPRVSPGKSWAGFWGGLAASLVLALLAWLLWPGGMALPLPALLGLAAFTALASVLGDLLESMVKRQRGVKDSGHLLPGHGGVLDRLDSMTAATPIFTLGLILLGW